MTSHRLVRPRRWPRTLRTPAILLIASVTGLVLALTGSGAIDTVAALLLALPVLAIARAGFIDLSSANIQR